MKALFSIPLIDSKEYTDLYRERERERETERERERFQSFVIFSPHQYLL